MNLQVPGWDDDLVAQIDGSDERAAAQARAWHAAARLDETADMIAAAVKRLYTRAADGQLEAVVDLTSGLQLRFDGRFGPAVGVPYCTTPRGAVMLAFSVGEPPTIDVAGLTEFATSINRWHIANAHTSR